MYEPFGSVWKKEMMRNTKVFIIDMFRDLAMRKNEQEKALSDLFQACSDLPLEEMNRMEKEINAASKVLKNEHTR